MYDDQTGFIAALGMIPLLFLVGVYCYFSFCQMKMAQKIGLSDCAWWAWIPIVGMFLLFKMASKPWWWFFLCLVPLVNIVVFAVLWYEAAKACNVPPIWGILVLVPVLNLIALGVMAFSGTPARPAPQYQTPQPRQPANV